jgi:hypothetical protein
LSIIIEDGDDFPNGSVIKAEKLKLWTDENLWSILPQVKEINIWILQFKLLLPLTKPLNKIIFSQLMVLWYIHA